MNTATEKYGFSCGGVFGSRSRFDLRTGAVETVSAAFTFAGLFLEALPIAATLVRCCLNFYFFDTTSGGTLKIFSKPQNESCFESICEEGVDKLFRLYASNLLPGVCRVLLVLLSDWFCGAGSRESHITSRHWLRKWSGRHPIAPRCHKNTRAMSYPKQEGGEQWERPTQRKRTALRRAVNMTAA